MLTAIIIITIVASILLILIVLSQNSKGGGLSGSFGGAATQTMGVQQSSDLLEKLTWGFIIGIFVLSLSTSFFVNKNGSGLDSNETEGIKQDIPPVPKTPNKTKPKK